MALVIEFRNKQQPPPSCIRGKYAKRKNENIQKLIPLLIFLFDKKKSEQISIALSAI